VPRAERRNAEPDEKPGMVAVQVAVFGNVSWRYGRIEE
jgi:hypothetical protein